MQHLIITVVLDAKLFLNLVPLTARCQKLLRQEGMTRELPLKLESVYRRVFARNKRLSRPILHQNAIATQSLYRKIFV